MRKGGGREAMCLPLAQGCSTPPDQLPCLRFGVKCPSTQEKGTAEAGGYYALFSIWHNQKAIEMHRGGGGGA